VQRVLSNDLWKEVRKRARASHLRKGAIAYVTRDLVGFRKGDTLVVDASVLAIKNGETDAPLLRKLRKKRVQIYDCADLHAKILLLDDVAIVGSGNMSSSSENRMVEAALISDHGSVVAGIACWRRSMFSIRKVSEHPNSSKKLPDVAEAAAEHEPVEAARHEPAEAAQHEPVEAVQSSEAAEAAEAGA
jgi:hypothetical protein